MTPRRQLGELEAQVLAQLAASDSAMTPPQVHAALDAGLAYTTVATTLNRLCSKGLLTRQEAGRTFSYHLAVPEADLIADRMHNHLRHAHDPAGALGQFVSGLNADEEQALRQVLDQLDGPE